MREGWGEGGGVVTMGVHCQFFSVNICNHAAVRISTTRMKNDRQNHAVDFLILPHRLSKCAQCTPYD